MPPLSNDYKSSPHYKPTNPNTQQLLNRWFTCIVWFTYSLCCVILFSDSNKYIFISALFHHTHCSEHTWEYMASIRRHMDTFVRAQERKTTNATTESSWDDETTCSDTVPSLSMCLFFCLFLFQKRTYVQTHAQQQTAKCSWLRGNLLRILSSHTHAHTHTRGGIAVGLGSS